MINPVGIVECPNIVSVEDCQYTTVLDEEEIYNSLREMSEKELASLGYTVEEIDKIKNNTLFSLLKEERGQLPVAVLENMGYSDEQVALLKDPDSADEKHSVIGFGGKLSLTCEIETLEFPGDGWTYATVYAHWIWNQAPAIRYRDAVTITWGREMYFMPYSENSKSRYTLYYRNSRTGAVAVDGANPLTLNHLEDAATVKIGEFDLVENIITHPVYNYDFCYKGAARIALKRHEQIQALAAGVTYVHDTNFISRLNISLIEGPLSIVFNFPTEYILKSFDIF